VRSASRIITHHHASSCALFPFADRGGKAFLKALEGNANLGMVELADNKIDDAILEGLKKAATDRSRPPPQVAAPSAKKVSSQGYQYPGGVVVWRVWQCVSRVV
jgi:hypothetical protein